MNKIALRFIARLVPRRVKRAIELYARRSPWDYIQEEVELFLPKYAGSDADAIKLIVIVGANDGKELERLLVTYKNCDFLLYEPSPRYYPDLVSNYASCPRVKTFNLAVSDRDGKSEFSETNLSGSGSLLQVGSLAKESYGMKSAESYVVECIRLEKHLESLGRSGDSIDCLWVDVQGAELLVLKGANDLLSRVRTVFIEVSVFSPLYVGGAVLHDLVQILRLHGLHCVGLGTDRNGTGNAIFARDRAPS